MIIRARRTLPTFDSAVCAGECLRFVVYDYMQDCAFSTTVFRLDSTIQPIVGA